jgi:arylsulfatase A-like enzyme
MDDQIGLILKQIEQMGVEDDTLVIYTSDQGYFLGEHNCFDKRMMWEESLRAPLVMKYPRLIPAGLKIGKGILVTNVDWAPTLLEFAQVCVYVCGCFFLGLVHISIYY